MNTHCGNGHEYTPENTGHFSNDKVSFRFCKQCARDRANKARALDPAAHNLRKNERQCVTLYGWTLAERDAELVAQGNACDICGRTGLKWGKGFNDVWHTDHEHDKPGTHRGILCATCNTALGKLEPHIIKVIQYLVKYNKTDLIKFLEGISNGIINRKDHGYSRMGETI
jgi:hypothetical protein